MKKHFPFLALILVVLSCTNNKKIEGFDETLWKKDFNACTNKREALVKILLDHKEHLKEFDDDAITDLLGSPERNRQFARGRKNYIYFVQPGKQCTPDSSREGKKLIIEFDALGNPRIIRESYIDF